MKASSTSGDEQTTLWNGTAGRAWVEAQDALDQIFEPFEALLVETVAARPRARVLDVGCGTGSTTLAFKRRLGTACQCVGIDISEPMLESARTRAARAGTSAEFICESAETHAFEPGSFDMIVSRFGVMFFEDSVRAFSNLRRAARNGADLCCIAWRSPAENPFMTAAERAAADILPNIPVREPDAPGQFAFADSNRVARILEQSGWTDIDIRPLDVQCTFAEADLVRYITRLGPVGRLLRDADDATKARVLAVVRPAFDPYVHGATVRFDAACWKISGRAG
jgi:ubiquinone/menaquinone biosynthesis C-methylase UbiE